MPSKQKQIIFQNKNVKHCRNIHPKPFPKTHWKSPQKNWSQIWFSKTEKNDKIIYLINFEVQKIIKILFLNLQLFCKCKVRMGVMENCTSNQNTITYETYHRINKNKQLKIFFGIKSYFKYRLISKKIYYKISLTFFRVCTQFTSFDIA